MINLRGFSLTILGRSLLLLIAELLSNVICWVVAAILFVPKPETRPIMSMALLAWTLGLRHALDADHISAIDNATRGLINLGQLPVTCGLFFSLGHSTIVIVVTIAIAVSTEVYNKLNGVGEVGGIVGAAVSGSFLFIVGLANSIILWRILRKRRRTTQQRPVTAAQDVEKVDAKPGHEETHEGQSTLTMRIIGPVMTFVNKPWKMYPVGVLFGFGFDTASSIALISISAIAKNQDGGQTIPSSYIIILPLLFTAGMTLLDSIDSIIMLYSYTGFPDRTWRLLERRKSQPQEPHRMHEKAEGDKEAQRVVDVIVDTENEDPQVARAMVVKTNVMSSLSIVLTVLSIILAFTISLITIMSLIGEQCSQCVEAAEAEDGGGLAGSWWRGWANAAEQSGWIGIGIVGSFVVIVGGWYLAKWVKGQRQKRVEAPADENAGSKGDGIS